MSRVGETSGQSVPKSRRPKFRQDSEQASPADKLHHEDTAGSGPAGGGDSNVPPTGKAKPDKDAARLHKSKLRMEKSGERLNTAKEKLAAQKPVKKPGPVKKTGRAVGRGVHGYVHGKIFQVEDENVGVEGAHRSELVGESAVRGTSRFVKRRVRSAPARAVRKAEREITSLRIAVRLPGAVAVLGLVAPSRPGIPWACSSAVGFVKQQAQPEQKQGGNMGMLLLVAAVVLIGGGAAFEPGA